MKTEPTTKASAKLTNLNLRVEPEMLARLDQIAAKSGISRSNLVRICLKSGFAKLEKMTDAVSPDAGN